tara:strand:+ start:18 stop:386 length:369 start_codon:yes stop_codon:yes gene_type:complete
MNDQRRRFKSRSQRNGFRGRNNRTSNNKTHFQSNGNIGRSNGLMTNPFNVEKTMQKYLQLAKDALSSGDPVLHQNYLQHAEHYSRRLADLNGQTKELKTSSNKSNLSTSLEKTNQTDNLKKI